MAPTYANIFMDKFQRKPIFDYFIETGLSPLIWFRFIDIFFSWTSDKESFNDFTQFAQDFSEKSNMKSKITSHVNISQNSVNFLDVKVILGNGILKATLFAKLKDFHLYVSYNSCHPSHVIRSIFKTLSNWMKEIYKTRNVNEKFKAPHPKTFT